VAQVILNRVRAADFPDTVCGVVYQGKDRRSGCQFSFACDGKTKRIREQKARALAERIAFEALSGQGGVKGLASATHYHATYVSPRWARSMLRLAKIGQHVFYEERGHTFLTASNERG
jgi:spore germination cell wall hydrolase CwlJ-like protein